MSVILKQASDTLKSLHEANIGNSGIKVRSSMCVDRCFLKVSGIAEKVQVFIATACLYVAIRKSMCLHEFIHACVCKRHAQVLLKCTSM